MKNINFAVSLGNSVTSIYKANVGVVLSERSAVVVATKGKRKFATNVGNDAVSCGLEYETIYKDGVLDFDLAELMLNEYLKMIEFKRNDGILFLVSLEQMSQAKSFKNLAYALGVNNVEVIPSIIATTYGFEIENFRKSFLLCDIGVKTEIAVVNNGRILTGATSDNGGRNIDMKIKEYILANKGIVISRETAEIVKNELATLLPHDERMITVEGFIDGTTEYCKCSVSSLEIMGIVIEEYSLIASAILHILSSCSSEVNADINKHGIYLCGASSKIVGIEKFLKVKLNLNSFIYRPESVTMLGAGQLLDSPMDIERVVAENSAD